MFFVLFCNKYLILHKYIFTGYKNKTQGFQQFYCPREKSIIIRSAVKQFANLVAIWSVCVLSMKSIQIYYKYMLSNMHLFHWGIFPTPSMDYCIILTGHYKPSLRQIQKRQTYNVTTCGVKNCWKLNAKVKCV